MIQLKTCWQTIPFVSPERWERTQSAFGALHSLLFLRSMHMYMLICMLCTQNWCSVVPAAAESQPRRALPISMWRFMACACWYVHYQYNQYTELAMQVHEAFFICRLHEDRTITATKGAMFSLVGWQKLANFLSQEFWQKPLLDCVEGLRCFHAFNPAVCPACLLLMQGKPLLHAEGMNMTEDIKLQVPLNSATTILPEISFQGCSSVVVHVSFHFKLGFTQSSCNLERSTLVLLHRQHFSRLLWCT